jgi:hypothetical protein
MAVQPTYKHLLKYGELARTLYLNSTSKDALGRHRGYVLYGMKVTPESATTLRVHAGAIVTPYGTRFYYEPDPAEAGDFTTIVLDGTTDAAIPGANERPSVIAIVARCQLDAGEQKAVDSSAEMAAAVPAIKFLGKRVSMRWKDGHPTEVLQAQAPIDLNAPQSGVANPKLTLGQRDSRTKANGVDSEYVLDPAAPTDVGWQEVVLGYLVFTTTNTGTTTGSVGGSGTWADDVEYVPAMGVIEGLESVLGTDVLLGRVSRIPGPPTGGGAAPQPSSANPALTGAKVKHDMGPSSVDNPLVVNPRFGRMENPSDGYRWPSFLRDGDSIIDALRRLDVVLRLWMNRTGDQDVVRWVQDGVQAPYAATGLPFQAPGDAVEDIFNVALTPNVAYWRDVDRNAANDLHTSNPTDTVLKSGRVAHTPVTDLSAILTDPNKIGDTERTAINAIDNAVWHVLADILGLAPSRQDMRSNVNWARNLAFLQHTDVPAGNQITRPTLAAAATDGYLDGETLMGAIAVLAKRINSGVGHNWLRNPRFMAGEDDTSAPFWVLDGATLLRTREANNSFAYVDISLTSGNRAFYQQVQNLPLPQSAGLASSRISFAAQVSVTAPTVAAVNLYNGGTLLASGQRIITNTSVETVSFSFDVSELALAPTSALIIFQAGAISTMRLHGVWVGVGNPNLMPAIDGLWDDFAARSGGVHAAMRGEFYFGKDAGNTHRGRFLADPVDDLDAVNNRTMLTVVCGALTAQETAAESQANPTVVDVTPGSPYALAAAPSYLRRIFTVHVIGGGGGGGSGAVGGGSNGNTGTAGGDTTVRLALPAGDRDITANGGLPGTGGLPETSYNGGQQAGGTAGAGGSTTASGASYPPGWSEVGSAGLGGTNGGTVAYGGCATCTDGVNSAGGAGYLTGQGAGGNGSNGRGYNTCLLNDARSGGDGAGGGAGGHVVIGGPSAGAITFTALVLGAGGAGGAGAANGGHCTNTDDASSGAAGLIRVSWYYETYCE